MRKAPDVGQTFLSVHYAESGDVRQTFLSVHYAESGDDGQTRMSVLPNQIFNGEIPTL
jgi:hypothetical protein